MATTGTDAHASPTHLPLPCSSPAHRTFHNSLSHNGLPASRVQAQTFLY